MLYQNLANQLFERGIFISINVVRQSDSCNYNKARDLAKKSKEGYFDLVDIAIGVAENSKVAYIYVSYGNDEFTSKVKFSKDKMDYLDKIAEDIFRMIPPEYKNMRRSDVQNALCEHQMNSALIKQLDSKTFFVIDKTATMKVQYEIAD